MDLRQINYFVVAFEEGSFSAAAERLNCTASGVSQTMSALEARLGIKLFERNRRGVTANAAGRLFYRRCLEILRTVAEAKNEIEDFSDGLSGSVSAGFGVALASAILPFSMAKITREYPGMDLNIVTGTADDLIDQVVEGKLDLYVGHVVSKKESTTLTPVGRFPLALISGSKLGLKPRAPIRVGEIPLKLVWMSGRNSLRPMIESGVRQGEIQMERSLTSTSLSNTLNFLGQTDWAAMLPFWIGLQEQDNPRLTVNPISEPDIYIDLCMIHQTQRPLSPPAQRLFDTVLKDIHAFMGRWESFERKI